MTTRRLIFHFYVNDSWGNNPVYGVHKYFLKKYASIFTEAIFVISLDNTGNWELIKEVEQFLVDCCFKNIKFVVEENTRLYEVETFKKYILQEMANLDGLTFFAHVKGVTDYNNTNMDKEAVLLWISSLYYLGLEFYKEAEWGAYTAKSCFFGGPLVKYSEKSGIYLPKMSFVYTGSFYWLNCKEINDRFKNNYPEIKNRYYAEHFPGNLCNLHDYEAFSHNYMMVNHSVIGGDMFTSTDIAMKYISAVLKETGEKEAFLNVYNNLKRYLVNNGVNY